MKRAILLSCILLAPAEVASAQAPPTPVTPMAQTAPAPAAEHCTPMKPIPPRGIVVPEGTTTGQRTETLGDTLAKSDGVLCPPDGVREARGALAPGVIDDGAGEIVEILGADAADVLDHLCRIARIVPLENLEYRARVLQGVVAQHPAVPERRSPTAKLVTRGARRRLGAVLAR